MKGIFICDTLAISAPRVETADTSTGVPADAPRVRSEMDVSESMVLLTWVSFLLAAFLLHKLAWKPIMAALDKRENAIKKSLEDLKLTQAQIESLKMRQQAMMAEADRQARDILEQGRQAAQAMAGLIEARAEEEARQMVDDARQDIQAARDRAVRELREESAALAVDLAGKLVRRKLDNEESRALTRRLIDEV